MAKPQKVKKISPTDDVEEAAVRILGTRLKEFYSHWPDPNDLPTEKQLHNLRISAKRLRYSAESMRELYPDRLALMIDLLKRSQDLLGEIQDCVTQRIMIEGDLKRLQRRDPDSQHILTLENIIADYNQRYALGFDQFREIWRGMSMKEFRNSLKTMLKRRQKSDSELSEPPLQLINAD